jgi:putative flippase GtrA
MNKKDSQQLKPNIKKYILYLIRWQLSTPILALVLYLLNYNEIVETIIANLIGGLIFFWVDRFIFKK